VTTLQPVRGTRDLLPDDTRRFRHVADRGRDVAARYGYQEIATPIFEFSEVFQRTLGETSDIVTKEMYTFTDKGGDNLTLRPEGTAGVARAVISGGLSHDLPLKYFYYGPMFRYERPQKGRLRQFHQIGVELLGVAEPLGDIEVIALGAAILREIGVYDRTTLELNTLGNAASRAAYREKLVAYFRDHVAALSSDSRERLDRNPLRILDSKDPRDREIVADAPLFGDSLDAESCDYFAAVRSGLDLLSIRYTVNPRLVRGLDYYCHTAFEFTTGALGAQGAVMAGGRYDGLMGMMGGPETPGVGWAAGVERLSMLLTNLPAAPRPVAVIPVGDAAASAALRICEDLRRAGIAVDLGYRGNLKRRLARANKVNARTAVIVGEDELARNEATVRDLDDGVQSTVPIADLVVRLRSVAR
jgi:histidyl-tRNA synthetase